MTSRGLVGYCTAKLRDALRFFCSELGLGEHTGSKTWQKVRTTTQNDCRLLETMYSRGTFAVPNTMSLELLKLFMFITSLVGLEGHELFRCGACYEPSSFYLHCALFTAVEGIRSTRSSEDKSTHLVGAPRP